MAKVSSKSRKRPSKQEKFRANFSSGWFTISMVMSRLEVSYKAAQSLLSNEKGKIIKEKTFGENFVKYKFK